MQHRLSPTFCLLSICSQAAEHDWGKAHNHSLVSSGSQPAKEPLHISPVKLLPYHQDNHWAPSLNIKLNPNLLILNFPWKNRSQHKRTSSSNYWIYQSTRIFTHTFLLRPCSSLTHWVCFCLLHVVFSPDSNIFHLKTKAKQTEKRSFTLMPHLYCPKPLEKKFSQTCFCHLTTSSKSLFLELSSPKQNTLVRSPVSSILPSLMVSSLTLL